MGILFMTTPNRPSRGYFTLYSMSSRSRSPPAVRTVFSRIMFITTGEYQSSWLRAFVSL